MIEDVVLESDEGESDEGEFFESDEAFAEAEDYGEDIGESARRRQRRARQYYRPGPKVGGYWPTKGAKGLAVRAPGGASRHVPFPEPLATTKETNRGLASQEVARRALEARLNRLETGFRAQQRKDSAASGLVTMVLSAGLAAKGFADASKPRFTLANWAKEGETGAAALVSLSQLATSGAKLAINGRYHRSGIGIAADAFAVGLIAAFSFGKLHKPRVVRVFPDDAALQKALPDTNEGDILIDQGRNVRFEVVLDSITNTLTTFQLP